MAWEFISLNCGMVLSYIDIPQFIQLVRGTTGIWTQVVSSQSYKTLHAASLSQSLPSKWWWPGPRMMSLTLASSQWSDRKSYVKIGSGFIDEANYLLLLWLWTEDKREELEEEADFKTHMAWT